MWCAQTFRFRLESRCCRNLLVVRDSAGYGLILAGDQPVYVQSVRAGGAAARAGVRENDVIKRVNGRLVTGDTHTDVVHLIQGEHATC